MKKTTNKKISNAIASTKTLNKPTIKFNIEGIENYDEMVRLVAIAKLAAGYNITASEFDNINRYESDCANEMFSEVEKMNDALINHLYSRISELTSQLKWANRPWYKKLMFWKKKPECNCLTAYC